MTIRGFDDDDTGPVVELSLTAWEPAFAGLEAELGSTVYRMLFPDWRASQAEAVQAVCRDPGHDVWVADMGGALVGFIAVAEIDEDASPAGEIVMVAVSPGAQRAGVGTALVRHAIGAMAERGLPLAVVATSGDPGHAPARALYEAAGFRPLPLVRYYRPL